MTVCYQIYIYIYIYIYVCIYIYTHIYTYIYIYTHIYKYIYIYIYIYIYVRVCICIHTHIRIQHIKYKPICLYVPYHYTRPHKVNYLFLVTHPSKIDQATRVFILIFILKLQLQLTSNRSNMDFLLTTSIITVKQLQLHSSQ